MFRNIIKFLKNSGGVIGFNFDVFSWNVIPRIKRMNYYQDSLSGKEVKGIKISFLFIRCEMWLNIEDNNTNLSLH
jgi:hypothetical protein